jgi:DNA repair exonuclease SbcCD ATPase subunit
LRPASSISPEEKAAMEALKMELDRHETSIREQKTALAERERFLDENEARLFSKMQEHQEKEMELDQKAEELNAREARIRLLDSQAPAASPPAAKSRKWDEFRE